MDSHLNGPEFGIGVEMTENENTQVEIQAVTIQSENSADIIDIYCDNSNNNTSTSQNNIRIQDCEFTNTGPVVVGCSTNGTIINTKFSEITGNRALQVMSSGTWVLDNVTVTDMPSPGGFTFQHPDIQVHISSSTFSNNIGIDGTVIEFTGTVLNISDSQFTGNFADNLVDVFIYKVEIAHWEEIFHFQI